MPGECHKSAIVLGVTHRVQIIKPALPIKPLDDPAYLKILREIISNEGVDLVGEEAGDDTTHAEQITDDLLGPGHYLNINPSQEDKERLDLERLCHGPGPGEPPVMYWNIEKNERKETFWVDRFVERTASKGLLVCGFFHAFSVASKLFRRKLEVEIRTYIPWDKMAESDQSS